MSESVCRENKRIGKLFKQGQTEGSGRFVEVSEGHITICVTDVFHVGERNVDVLYVSNFLMCAACLICWNSFVWADVCVSFILRLKAALCLVYC